MNRSVTQTLEPIGKTANAGATMPTSDIVEFLIWAAKHNMWLCEAEEHSTRMNPTTRMIHEIVNEFYGSRVASSNGSTR